MKKTSITTPALSLKNYNSNTFVDGGMEIRFAVGPEETKQFDTQKLIDNFLVKDLMVSDQLKLVYTHYDRVMIGGAVPANKTLLLWKRTSILICRKVNVCFTSWVILWKQDR